MAKFDRRSEEKRLQEAEAKASFDRLDEKEKNMWTYSARKMLISSGEDSEPEHSLIESHAFDAWYEYSRRTRKGIFCIPKKEKVIYDKLDDKEKARLEHAVRQMLINDSENPDKYPVGIMAFELWYEKKDREMTGKLIKERKEHLI